MTLVSRWRLRNRSIKLHKPHRGDVDNIRFDIFETIDESVKVINCHLSSIPKGSESLDN